MALAVFDAIVERGTLVAEAGTGTGKTFAYLVPALLAGGKVLLSVGTKTLKIRFSTRTCGSSAARSPAHRCRTLKGRRITSACIA